jgi:hypothetical protein
MAATKNLNIRLSPERKAALQELADAFGESLTEFVLKSVYARVRLVTPGAAPAGDPFVLALRAAAKGKRSALAQDEKEAIKTNREARQRGARAISVAEARRQLLA